MQMDSYQQKPSLYNREISIYSFKDLKLYFLFSLSLLEDSGFHPAEAALCLSAAQGFMSQCE